MDASQLAAAAASAATEGTTAKAPSVIKEIAKLSVQFSHSQLQTATAQVVLECLKLCEQHSQKCLTILVEALRVPNAAPELVLDAAWTLNKLTQHCELTRQWLLNTNGFAAVQNALLAYPTHSDLVHCSVGIVYNIDGLRGLDTLLMSGASGRGAALPDDVLAVIAWAVFDLVKDEDWDGVHGASVLSTIIHILKCRSHSLEVQNACCSALAAMVPADAQLGVQLVELGGCEILFDIFRSCMNLGGRGEDVAGSIANTIVSLTEASSFHAEFIRQKGGVPILAEFCMKGTGSKDEEAALWAIGHLAGLETVVQIMAQRPTLPSIIRGGLDSITELASYATELQEVKFLVTVLSNLWTLLEQMSQSNPAVKCRTKCLAAICSVVIAIAPHAEPGQVPELDQAVVNLLKLQALDISAHADVDMAENTIESLGRLGLIKPSWRDFLKRCGTEQVLAQRIETGHGHKRLLKYTFWAAAALSGLPFVCRELELHPKSPEHIDAAFCTIIDILDDDLEGEWVLAAAQRCDEDAIPSMLNLIAEAMRSFMKDNTLQSRGCHCIGLLVPLTPRGAVPTSAVTALFNAVRWHAGRSHVVRDALFAFHALMEPGAGANAGQVSSHDVRKAQVEQLREGGAEFIAKQALVDHGTAHNSELLEEAVIALCGLSGVDGALKVLVDAEPGPVRTAGIKAIAEFGRHQPALLRQVAAEVRTTVARMASESSENEDLQRNAALLIGFCNS